MDHSAARTTAAAPEAGQLHVVLVMSAGTGGVGAHVRSLAQGLVAHGVGVTVCAPAGTDALFGFSRTGARFHLVDITPTAGARSDATAIGELRRAFTGADVVHAHGLRAGLLSDLALRTAGRFPGLRPETPLVVTSHQAMLATGMERRLQRLMERRVARAADLVLGACSDLVARARELGAGDARLGPVAAPPMPPGGLDREAARAALLGERSDRPVVLAVGRLVPQKAFGLLLDAARELAGADPRPLVVIAGRARRAPGCASGPPPRACRSSCSATAPTSPTCSRPPTWWSSAVAGRPVHWWCRRRCGRACRWSRRPSAASRSWSATRRCSSRPVTRPRSAGPCASCWPIRSTGPGW